MEEETKFLAVRELAQQLDVLLDSQQKLSLSVRDIPDIEKPDMMRRQDGLIQGYMKLSRKIDPGLALALYIQKELWESYTDIDNLWKMNPWANSNEFDYSFEQYACARLDRQWVTITNWLQTAKIHFVEDHAPKEPIALIDARSGLVLLGQENGETTPITKKWDPFSVDFSKLLLCNKAAREGSLDETGWGLLMNPDTKWDDLRDFLHDLLPWKRTPIQEHHEMSFFIQNGMLFVRKGGLSEVVGTLEINSENLLVREGVARLIRVFHIAIIV